MLLQVNVFPHLFWVWMKPCSYWALDSITGLLVLLLELIFLCTMLNIFIEWITKYLLMALVMSSTRKNSEMCNRSSSYFNVTCRNLFCGSKRDFVTYILQLLWLCWLHALQKQGVKFVISIFWDCHNIDLANLALRDKRWSLKQINAVMMLTAIMLFAGAKERILKSIGTQSWCFPTQFNLKHKW